MVCTTHKKQCDLWFFTPGKLCVAMIETYSFKLIPSWEKYEIRFDHFYKSYILHENKMNMSALVNRESVMNIDFNKSLIVQDRWFIIKGLLNRYVKKSFCVKILHLYPLKLLSPRKCTKMNKNPMLKTWHVLKILEKRIKALWWNCSKYVQYFYTGYDLFTLTTIIFICQIF